jgi:PD-(D/E)XK nuclease superfamily
MATKISHSSISTYLSCPKSYQHKYKNKIYPKYQGSALFFGSAIDEALNDVLANHKKVSDEELIQIGIKKFNEKWEQKEDRNFGLIDLPKYEYVLYSRYDFDGDILEKEDWREVYASYPDATQKLSLIQDKLKSLDFQDLESEDKMFYNYLNWLSLRRKGHYLIEAYVTQLMPNIEEVIEVQKNLEIEDEHSNKITGIADFVCKLKAGEYGRITLMEPEVVIPDNKTSSMDYDEDSVATSQQLSQYRTILNNQGYNITKGAYFVMKKKLNKNVTKTCKSCGHVATGSHKTCDNVINGTRCNGAWDKVTKVSVDTQLVVDTIPAEFSSLVMENADDIIKAIESDIFPRNLNACKGMYGSPCPYFGLCHKNDMTNLVQGKDNK